MKVLIHGICQIFKKPFEFLLSLIMLAVGMIAVMYTLMDYTKFHYVDNVVKDTVKHDLNDVYYINVDFNNFDPESYKDVIKAVDEIKALDGTKLCGGFFVDGDYETDSEISLYIEPDLLGLCSVKSLDKNDIEFDENDGIKEAYIGYGLQDIYNVGDVISDNYSEKQFKIKGVLAPKQKWLSDDIYGNPSVKLDNCIVFEVDEVKLDSMTDLMHSYIVVNGTNGVNKQIDDILNKLDAVTLNTMSVNDTIENYEAELKQVAYEIVVLPIITCISASIVIIISAILSFKANKNDYGIMLSNGLTRKNIICIESFCNFIKCGLAYIIFVLYWMKQKSDFYELQFDYYKVSSRIMALIFAVVFIGSSCYGIIYVLRHKTYDMISERKE